MSEEAKAMLTRDRNDPMWRGFVSGLKAERDAALARAEKAGADTLDWIKACELANEMAIHALARNRALEEGLSRLGSMRALVMSRWIDPDHDAELLARIDFARALLEGAAK